MKQYVERDAVIAHKREYFLGGSYDNTEFAVPFEDILAIPAADVKPLVHGKWKQRRFSKTAFGYECSVCHTTWDTITEYCPFCGSEMR